MSLGSVAPVVVGIDGSRASADVAGTAAAMAAAARLPLVVLQVAEAPRTDAAQARSEQLLRAAVSSLRRAHPGLPVGPERAVGDPADTLRQWSRRASLLVLGDRGRRRPDGRPAGSVTRALVQDCASPLLVCHRRPDGPRPPGSGPAPVAVGVALGPGDDAAIGWAFAEADRRGAGLVAVHVRPAGEPAAAVQPGLAEALDRWAEKYPRVPVRRLVRSGLDPAVVLMGASRTAQLVVVGAGRGGAGSVGLALAHRAHCPVLVVPSA